LAERRSRPVTSRHSSHFQSRLEELRRTFDHPDAASDPVHIVRRYAAPDDREVVGFCASALAFGRVASVLNSIELLVAAMGPHPAAFVRAFDAKRDRAAIDPLVHRWIRGQDLVALMLILQRMLAEAGTLESFCTRALETDLSAAYPRVPKRPGVCYFFPRPSAGSACKRLNLFLRWMARRDAVDLGTWTQLSPSRLIIPLDTHVIRLGRCLRLTRYSSPNWKMAAEITASLRAINLEDPVRYDFSLCHVGMMNACGYGRAQGDRHCPLRGICRPKARA
jgi:uncharacterized protein (TIGR02757 family)